MHLAKRLAAAQAQQLDKTLDVQKPKTLSDADNFTVATPSPLIGMAHNSGTHHIEINVAKAIPQMLSVLYHRAMKSLFPKGAAPVLAPVIVLRELTFQLLHETAQITETQAHQKQMNMVAGNTEVQENDPVFVDGVPQAAAVLDSINSAT